ncbi:MAG: hypothetical protein PSV13_15110 [Lacunisphaera sp.]|nr:hypothetical protein [Lacunisphaera sp.]
MRITPGLLAAVLALSVCPGRAIERLPIEDFSRVADTTGARLSPDGKSFGFLRDFHGLTMLHVADLETNKVTRLDVSESVGVANSGKEVGSFRWIGNGRLAATTLQDDRLFGVVAMDRDGKRLKGLVGLERDRMELSGPSIGTAIQHAFNDEEQNILLLA